MKIKSLVSVLLIVFVLFACKSEKKDTEQPKKADTTAVKDTMKQESKKEEPKKEVIPITSTFKFTLEPTLEMIPDEPVQGAANGEGFNPKAITIEPKFNSWYIILYENPLESPESTFPEGQYLNVELPKAPKPGEVLTRENATGGGWWQMKSSDDKTQLTSLNASHAYVIQFTEWELKKWDPKGPNVQIAGKASGKLAVCYQGFSDYKDSWVAGTFKDVPVRYVGKPDIKNAKKK